MKRPPGNFFSFQLPQHHFDSLGTSTYWARHGLPRYDRSLTTAFPHASPKLTRVLNSAGRAFNDVRGYVSPPLGDLLLHSAQELQGIAQVGPDAIDAVNDALKSIGEQLRPDNKPFRLPADFPFVRAFPNEPLIGSLANLLAADLAGNRDPGAVTISDASRYSAERLAKLAASADAQKAERRESRGEDPVADRLRLSSDETLAEFDAALQRVVAAVDVDFFRVTSHGPPQYDVRDAASVPPAPTQQLTAGSELYIG